MRCLWWCPFCVFKLLKGSFLRHKSKSFLFSYELNFIKAKNEVIIYFFCDMMTLMIILLYKIFILAEDDYSYSEFRPGKQNKIIHLTLAVIVLKNWTWHSFTKKKMWPPSTRPNLCRCLPFFTDFFLCFDRKFTILIDKVDIVAFLLSPFEKYITEIY